MPRVCITVPGKNAQPYRFSLERKVVRLGRSSDNDIVVDCPSISSKHCEMRRVEGGYLLEDTGSTNGISLDDTRMKVIDLDNGMEVKIGDVDLDFELTPEERADLAEEERVPRQQAQLPDLPEKKEEERETAKEPAAKSSSTPAAGPAAPPRAAAPLTSAQSSGGINFLISMCFLVLAALAFWLGLSTKHRAETGRNLWEDISGGGPGEVRE